MSKLVIFLGLMLSKLKHINVKAKQRTGWYPFAGSKYLFVTINILLFIVVFSHSYEAKAFSLETNTLGKINKFIPLIYPSSANISAAFLAGSDSSAFGDSTAANQNTILGLIGQNSSAVASTVGTLFDGQRYIADGVDTLSRLEAGDYFSVGGNPNYCVKKTLSASGTVTTTNVNNCAPCDTGGKYCDNGVCNTWTCGKCFSVTHTAGSVAPATATISYSTITSSLSGASKCWILQNLGASQQATSATDSANASAGWYWQFNRAQGYAVGPSPAWTITSLSEGTGWLAENDPCTLLLGSGWRLPTYYEWQNADTSGSWNNFYNPYSSALKIHGAGYLYAANGSLGGRGSYSAYWSSTYSTAENGGDFEADGANSAAWYTPRANGLSVRCLKD
jgi:hypothetical protein